MHYGVWYGLVWYGVVWGPLIALSPAPILHPINNILLPPSSITVSQARAAGEDYSKLLGGECPVLSLYLLPLLLLQSQGNPLD